MSLYWPDAEADVKLGEPRLHALVVAAGDYPHRAAPAIAGFRLGPLTTAAHTGPLVVEWLVAAQSGCALPDRRGYQNPACPLGSVEFLRSPSGPVTRRDGKSVAVDAATMANIELAVKAWYKRCDTHAGNVALLYFVGHGLNTASQFLLASDFGDPQSIDLWGQCLDFNAFRVGMRKNKAAAQLYFLDACRERPVSAQLHVGAQGKALVTGATIHHAAAVSAAYYAAGDGAQALGPAIDATYFSAALLDALEGAGAHNPNGQWLVDSVSLASALGTLTRSRAARLNQPLTYTTDASAPAAVVQVPAAPVVHASIGCQSAQANQQAAIELHRGADVVQSVQGQPRPFECRLHPGDWTLDITFQSLPPIKRLVTLMPPVFDREEPV